MSFWLFQGDCLGAMRSAADASVDAIVTDPPYGLSFMGKKWDYDVPSVEVFAEMFRVLKPGGRLLCFAGTRTFHRMWCNIEDAGFTIEDTVAWMYGSGFPKHKSKLKPAFEPICVARKGDTSVLNIGACRIGTDEVITNHSRSAEAAISKGKYGNSSAQETHQTEGQALGRWPANIALDEEAAALLDEHSGVLKSGDAAIKRATGSDREGNTSAAFGAENRAAGTQMIGYGDKGGASRFFYCAKASRGEREAGLEAAPKQSGGSNAKGFTDDVANGNDRNKEVANHHPTVKPIELMRWLVRLITTQGDVVLDPFMGSGTTGIAATLEGRDFIGIDLDAAYLQIAQRRIEHWQAK